MILYFDIDILILYFDIDILILIIFQVFVHNPHQRMGHLSGRMVASGANQEVFIIVVVIIVVIIVIIIILVTFSHNPVFFNEGEYVEHQPTDPEPRIGKA